MVQDDAGRHAKASMAPRHREGEMQVCWQRVREPVKRKGRLMRKDTRAFGPQPRCDQPLVCTGGEMNEPVDPSAHPNDAATVKVMDEQLRGVPHLGCLFGREQALLPNRDLEEAAPVWAFHMNFYHAQNLSLTL